MSFLDKYKLCSTHAANIESTNKHMSDTWNLSNIYRSELICQPGLPMVMLPGTDEITLNAPNITL